MTTRWQCVICGNKVDEPDYAPNNVLIDHISSHHEKPRSYKGLEFFRLANPSEAD